MWALGLLFGLIVGFSLGLTGGGGSLFAVPLLVYGLSMPMKDAVGVSLAAVGITALIGAVERLRKKQVELRTGLIFAFAGMAGAPVGAWIAGMMPEAALLILFALLMLIIAVRIWRKATPRETEAEAGPTGRVCIRDADGNMKMTSPCALMLVGVGLAAGVMSGMFGVGGGFVIVPALVLFAGMKIHRAVATSLLVIALIGASGTASHLLRGGDISLLVTALFVGGGTAGMFLGNLAGRKISGPALQRVFAASIVAVAVFVITKTVV